MEAINFDQLSDEPFVLSDEEKQRLEFLKQMAGKSDVVRLTTALSSVSSISYDNQGNLIAGDGLTISV